MSYIGQLKAKEEIFAEIMQRQAGLALNASIERLPEEWGYRLRVQWHWTGRNWEVHSKGNTQGEKMRECLVVDPLLQDVLERGTTPRYAVRAPLTTSDERVLTGWCGESVGSLWLRIRRFSLAYAVSSKIIGPYYSLGLTL